MGNIKDKPPGYAAAAAEVISRSASPGLWARIDQLRASLAEGLAREAEVRMAAQELKEAVEFTPLGVRGLLAVARLRDVLSRLSGDALLREHIEAEVARRLEAAASWIVNDATLAELRVRERGLFAAALEGAVHRHIRGIAKNRRQEGYLMGAFRAAVAEVMESGGGAADLAAVKASKRHERERCAAVCRAASLRDDDMGSTLARRIDELGDE